MMPGKATSLARGLWVGLNEQERQCWESAVTLYDTDTDTRGQTQMYTQTQTDTDVQTDRRTQMTRQTQTDTDRRLCVRARVCACACVRKCVRENELKQ